MRFNLFAFFRRPVVRTAVWLLAVPVGMGNPNVAQAELPPSAYAAWKKEAPEHLSIEVTSVKNEVRETETEKITTVTLEAKVEKVVRTATGIVAGTILEIAYEHREHKTPWAGPSQVPILEKGTKCPAFLKRTGGDKSTYAPAAGGHSFDEG